MFSWANVEIWTISQIGSDQIQNKTIKILETIHQPPKNRKRSAWERPQWETAGRTQDTTMPWRSCNAMPWDEETIIFSPAWLLIMSSIGWIWEIRMYWFCSLTLWVSGPQELNIAENSFNIFPAVISSLEKQKELKSWRRVRKPSSSSSTKGKMATSLATTWSRMIERLFSSS